jgi:uncharacterized protein YciI
VYLLLARYSKPAEEVDRHLEAHKAWIGEHTAAGRFVATAREVPLIGGVIVATGGTIEEMREIVARDPFVLAGCSEYDIREFTPVRTAEGLERLLEL